MIQPSQPIALCPPALAITALPFADVGRGNADADAERDVGVDVDVELRAQAEGRKLPVSRPEQSTPYHPGYHKWGTAYVR